jgi:hypothetical protein
VRAGADGEPPRVSIGFSSEIGRRMKSLPYFSEARRIDCRRVMKIMLFFMIYQLQSLCWGIGGMLYDLFFSFSLGVPTLFPLLHKPDGARRAVLTVYFGVTAHEALVA